MTQEKPNNKACSRCKQELTTLVNGKCQKCLHTHDITLDSNMKHTQSLSEEEYTVSDATRDINAKIDEAYVRGMAEAREEIVEMIEKENNRNLHRPTYKARKWCIECGENIISKIKEL